MQLTYTGEPDRYYPTLGLAPDPGQDYDLDAHPRDGRWHPDPAPEPEPPAEETAVEDAAPARRRLKKETTDA